MLCQEAVKGATAWPSIEPQNHGSALRILLGLHKPVVEALGAGAFEVAGVLAERRLLGQPGQEADLVLVGGRFALGRAGEQQQQLQQEEDWRPQLGSEHLRSSQVSFSCLFQPFFNVLITLSRNKSNL